jgi:hypothetical protein
MKHQQAIFHKPAILLQVYRMINEYDKTEKSFADRKDNLVWKAIQSTNGYVSDDELYLPSSIHQDSKFKNCDLITVEDEADITPQQEWKIIGKHYEKSNNHCFNLHHLSTYEFFGFRKDPVELSLRYNSSLVGDPSRDNFVLTTLEKDHAVEIKINGKMDTSRGRYFKEQYYIFQVLGVFDKCFLLKEEDKAVIKTVPSGRKMIDLLKPLW